MSFILLVNVLKTVHFTLKCMYYVERNVLQWKGMQQNGIEFSGMQRGGMEDDGPSKTKTGWN